ncbi:MAG: peptide chain release factor N(5)-glutamine methyltransferase [Halanaerobiales bacterium]
MNIKEVLQKTEDYLSKHGVTNARLDAEVLLADLLGMDRIKLYINFDYPLTAKELTTYRKRIKKRAQRLPVAYITGHKEFMSLDLEIEEGVLIPRPETEELVENIISYCKERDITDPNIVDVGTGSGAIMVSLGYYLEGARIAGIDISPRAVKVARSNIKKHELDDRLKVIKGDLLQPLIKRDKKNVDIVISNPPYIDNKGMEDLPPEVKTEPVKALAGGDDGCRVYERLIPQAARVLRPGGLLALEIGQAQVGRLEHWFQSDEWLNYKLRSDYSGRERMVFAHRVKRG